MSYYYISDGTEVTGPYSLEEIQRDLFSGLISQSSQVCAEGTQTWLSLDSLIEPAQISTPSTHRLAQDETPTLLGESNRILTKLHYSYIDKIFKKERGPYEPELLAHAWFNNRISRESMIHIQELDQMVPLWMIPDFSLVRAIRRKKWRHLLITAAIAFPIVIMMAKCVSDVGYSVPDTKRERRAKQFFSDPDNRDYYNEYMREKRRE